MKNLLLVAVATLLLSSCTKESTESITEAKYSSKIGDVTVYFKNANSPTTFPIMYYTDIKLTGTTLRFIPNKNCATSVAFCQNIYFLDVSSYKVSNENSINCN